MKELLDKGVDDSSSKKSAIVADVNARDEDGQTGLMWAAAMGHSLCVKLIAEHGGFMEARCKEGYTALHYAAVEKRVRIVRQLVSAYKCDVNSLTNEKHTPLHKASRYGSIDIATVLIDHGALINAKDIRGRTPLDLARNSEYRQFLLKRGAQSGLVSGIGDGIEGKPVTILGESGVESDEKKDPSGAGEASGAEMETRKRNEMAAEVEGWLGSLLLSEYSEHFLNNGYDRIDAIIEMQKGDLEEIEVKKGHIRLLLKSINELRESKLKTLSFVREFAEKSDSDEQAKLKDGSILDEPGQAGSEEKDGELEEEEIDDDGIKEMELKMEEEDGDDEQGDEVEEEEVSVSDSD